MCCFASSKQDGNEAFSTWFKHFHQNKPVSGSAGKPASLPASMLVWFPKLQEPPPAAPAHAEFRDSVAYDHKLRQYLVGKSMRPLPPSLVGVGGVNTLLIILL